MRRFAARLLAYGAAAIPCAVFLAFQGTGPAVAAAARGHEAHPVSMAGVDPTAAARPRR